MFNNKVWRNVNWKIAAAFSVAMSFAFQNVAVGIGVGLALALAMSLFGGQASPEEE